MGSGEWLQGGRRKKETKKKEKKDGFGEGGKKKEKGRKKEKIRGEKCTWKTWLQNHSVVQEGESV